MDSINSIAHLLELIKGFRVFPDSILLFRGQSKDLPLLPSLCRTNPKNNTETIEKKMLKEFRNRSNLLIDERLQDNWDWITYAQHFGMKTRLLDWTLNPLVALWFAIKNDRYLDETAYLYIFFVEDEDLLTDEDRESGPFDARRTKVLKPILNNKRVIAQQGWFTSHAYSNKNNCFLPMSRITAIKNRVITFKILPNKKNDMLDELNILGVNYQTLYPDVVGLCEQINWENRTISSSLPIIS